jgi:hypothetical protein
MKSPMLAAVPYLSVSHGYLSCTNIDDGLHTYTPCSHICQTSVVYTWLRAMNTHPDIPAAHLARNATVNMYVYFRGVHVFQMQLFEILHASSALVLIYCT